MMKKMLAVLLLGVSFSAWADEASQLKAIDELLVETKMESLINNVRVQMQKQNQGMLDGFLQQHQTGGKPLNAAQQAAVDRYNTELSKLMDDILAWDHYKPFVEKIYQETFTEAEIVELVAFYKTPLGQKMVDKMPSVTDASMRNMRGMVEQMIPKAQQIGQNFAEEFEKASDDAKAEAPAAAKTKKKKASN